MGPRERRGNVTRGLITMSVFAATFALLQWIDAFPLSLDPSTWYAPAAAVGWAGIVLVLAAAWGRLVVVERARGRAADPTRY